MVLSAYPPRAVKWWAREHAGAQARI